MFEKIKKLCELSDKRLCIFLENREKHKFYQWYKTYLDWIIDEIEEVKDEIKKDNHVYLEDELWDIFWDYLCLLNSLKKEWYISSVENVFERSFKKYTQRLNIETWENNWTWDEVKKLQKEKLKKEMDDFLNNKK